MLSRTRSITSGIRTMTSEIPPRYGESMPVVEWVTEHGTRRRIVFEQTDDSDVRRREEVHCDGGWRTIGEEPVTTFSVRHEQR